MNQRGIYNYEPIRPAGEIRLLKLRPGQPGDTIRADIETARIGGSRRYDAISYTWADENGDATKCCSIRIGAHGLPLPITRNCDTVLRRVSRHSNTVWIDAVCINQEDIRERGKQVDLMPEIYMGASWTFAYVGEASDNSDTVLRNLAGGIWTPPYLLEPFFRRPYFSRVWVVQEIALSSRIIMMCGDTTVNWTEFMHNENLSRIYTRRYHETFPTLFKLDRRHSLRSATALHALFLSQGCNASDPRDKVFGLMGLVSAEQRLSADYSLSTAEVYTQMAIHYCKNDIWRLDMILGSLCCRNDETKAQSPDLPSWVPDWKQGGSTLLQRVPEAQIFLRAQEAIFRDDDKKGLFLRGAIVGGLAALEENENIKTWTYLSNEWARITASEKLPFTYSDKSIYVFSTESQTLSDSELDPE